MALDDDTTADVQELVLAGGTPDETLAASAGGWRAQ
jgi:hypothetical protein